MNKVLYIILISLFSLTIFSCAKKEKKEEEKDTTAPTVSSISPTDNQTGVSISENISVTFSEAMDTASVTTNTSDTSCSGSFQLSSDTFSTCVQMSSSPSSSNSDKTFTVDPSSNLSYATSYKIRVTTGVKDSAGNVLGSQYETSTGFTTESAPVWAQEAYVKASNNGASDGFSYSVALDGGTLAVAAYGEDSNQTTITNDNSTASSNNSNYNSGAVYVYKRTGTTWAQEAYVKASNNDASDNFGYSVALDGDTLAVGAYLEDSNQTTITNDNSTASSNDTSNDSGAVYVYKRTGTTWEQEAYIKASNSEANDYFGNSVALDGDTLVVGAYGEDSNQTTITNDNSTASSNNSNNRSGAVYVYKHTGTTWEQEAYIKASNSEATDWFGSSVALDGDTLVVGAYKEESSQTTITNDNSTASSDNSNNRSGAVYVYKRTGTTWEQEAYIKASNSEATDEFGFSVALDNDTLAVGVREEDSNQTTITNDNSTASSNNSNNSSGAVYVYKRTGTTWAQEAYVKASNNDAIDYFGHWVALYGDTMAVGAKFEDSNQTTITNDNSTASSDDSSSASGAVYVYKRTGTTWAQEAYVKASNNDASDHFGSSVALDNNTLAVGAYGEDSSQDTITNGTTSSDNNSSSGSGAVYVYNWAPSGPLLMGGSIQGTALSLTGEVTTFAGTGSHGSEDGTGTSASFRRTRAITTDGTNLYVSENGYHLIRKIVISTGVVTTLAGTGSSGSANGTGTSASFNAPHGITTDGTNLYVADRSNYLIRKIVISTGAVTTLAGTAGSYGSADGTGTSASFYNPSGVTTDGTNLYVVDTGFHKIRKIVISTGAVTTVAGTGSPGSADGTGTSASFKWPSRITTDGTNLYVADYYNSLIRKIVISTGAVTTLAGTAGSSGSADGTGTSASFNTPQGITTDGTNLYVAEYGNHLIRKIVISTGAVTTLAGTAGSSGSADGTGTSASFSYPDGITTDGTNLYVVDYANYLIRKIE